MKRREFLKATGAGILATGLGAAHGQFMKTKKSPNILFLGVDDLRPQLGCYGLDWMHTPNLDRLASGGTLFENAYSQYPICGPSRASMLSGIRPTPERFTKWNAEVREDMPGIRTLPEHFLKNGYATSCFGKVFHDIADNAHAWSGTAWYAENTFGEVSYKDEKNRAIAREHVRGPAFERGDAENTFYADGHIADRTIGEMRELAAGDAPFFLAAGFMKPHLPFIAPKEFWDLYQPDELPATPTPDAPVDAPAISLHDWAELRSYYGIPAEGPLDPEMARTLVHGYCAATSYMDSQVGRVLDELDRLGLADSTIVVLWTDHGMQLGEHGMWAKHCLYETSLHCPLIFRGPGVASGGNAPGLVEFLDIYPTLCELAGLETPEHLQGTSAMPQLQDASRPGKAGAFSRIDRGESLKTPDARYTEWRDSDGQITDRMLYDHRTDPHENINVAESPEYQDQVTQLSKQLNTHLETRS